MTGSFTESVVEEAAMEWFDALGYQVVLGSTIAAGEPAAERTAYEQVLFEGRLREALRRLNPAVPAEAIGEAFRKLTRISSTQLVDANHELHYDRIVPSTVLLQVERDSNRFHDKESRGGVSWERRGPAGSSRLSRRLPSVEPLGQFSLNMIPLVGLRSKTSRVPWHMRTRRQDGTPGGRSTFAWAKTST